MADTVTLLEGTTFCISEQGGDIRASGAQGLFARDTRVLSRWTLTFNGDAPIVLDAQRTEPYRATYLSRIPAAAGQGDSTTMLVVRDRHVGDGMREQITLRNLTSTEASGVLRLGVDADFADLFEVKDGRTPTASRIVRVVDDEGIGLSRTRGVHHPAVHIRADGTPDLSPQALSWNLVVPSRGECTVVVHVAPVLDGVRLTSSHDVGHPLGCTKPARRFHEWRHGIPELTSGDAGLSAVLARSVEDLGALRIFDDQHPDRAVVAAGAPWFMALFGRDSILTSWMLLPLDSSMTVGTLQTLADHQGTLTDAVTEEQPGRILHEIRFGLTAVDLTLGGGRVYYGTADATSLFVMLLGELSRWGGDPAIIGDLLPHADRALDWIENAGDRDGDGFVEYQCGTDHGLVNQGWKDSWDGISFADGRLPTGPIALAEVQAYTYAALLARAGLAQAAGDDDAHHMWSVKAADLKRRFNEAFWIPDRGWFAVGLDGDKQQIDSLTSNIGHCLWTGIVDNDKAAAVADHLLSPDLFTGWGIRTLASSMARFNPMGYHNGSVWPHDNALCAAGLMRYGFVDHAQRVITGLLAAADDFGHRLPELFSGFDRADFASPVPYPTACSPQAWAAAAPLSFLRTLLRFDPDSPRGQIACAPSVPEQYLPLGVHGIRVDGHRLTIDVTADGWVMEGLGDARFKLTTSQERRC
ncbi:amylo-alpha-1,6-glucosidase [Nocardioides nematodiphilus]|uniref:amylo-alpha-1,6-glucosidase n=1 Tax=Nocardioides nematodiphilus TaxID=2849669 RepID=UPI001CDA364A|nr:glycogen debranching N-terminal domain-containing protein [Nocardioides nematodiphilus]MCA1983794.1 amylo-alpha-1,6-glucosidase [Nocardioides nematodiphilus]